MTDGSGEHPEFLRLLGAIREGRVTEKEFAQFDRLLAGDPALQRSYVDYMLLCADLRRYHGMPERDEAGAASEGWACAFLASELSVRPDQPQTQDILEEVIEQDRLTADEQAAEEARREAEAQREAIRREAEVALERFKEQERLRQEELAYREHLARRRQLAVTVLCVVALLVSVALVWLSRWQAQPAAPATPVAVVPPVVARIAEASNALWAQADFSTARGTQLTASTMSLTEGLVELAFNGGTSVLVQAPATLRLESADQMFLVSGTIAVTVAEGSTGFVVRTPTGTVVDYGTEFGVLVNGRGETETLVFKGKVGLRSGSDPVRSVASLMLTEGQAGAVDTTGDVQERVFQPAQVVREISETPGLGIPGRQLDLADVIGGGNGFGTGRLGTAINPLTGLSTQLVESDRSGVREYAPVAWNRYVDGVFVPDGERSRIVSSEGHVFDECPSTNNVFNMEITNVGDAKFGLQWLGRRAYGSRERPCILMHANLGITFDLAAMAAANPGSRLTHFVSGFGVSQRATSRPCNADFWVLVDGEIRYSRRGVTRKGLVDVIDIELLDGDRFLTLMTTDGGDPDGESPPDRSTDSDWCLFAEPILELAPAADPIAVGRSDI